MSNTSQTNLRIPGPTPVTPEILKEMSRFMINHRGDEFRRLIESVTVRLKKIYGTSEDLHILTASGTGAMEAAIVNTLSPGDPVLAITIGAFGDRFANIAEMYGANVKIIRSELGEAADPDTVKSCLNNHPDIKAVLVTHNETSTGVTNDLETIAKIVKNDFGKLLLVDGVSSVGSVPLKTDSWRCDAVASASQKGWMAPPGLAFLSFSLESWKANTYSTMPKFYFDLRQYKKYMEIGQPPWTPNLSLFFALDKTLDLMLAEGVDNIHSRHTKTAQKFRDGVQELGLKLLAKPECASDTITSVLLPDGIQVKEFLSIARLEHNVELAGGQQSLASKIFRIGHLGLVTDDEISQTLSAIKHSLEKLK